MKAFKFLSVATCLLLALGLLAGCAQMPRQPAAAPTAKPDDATVTKIEALVNKTMQEHQIPGVAVAIVKDGQVAFSQGFGVAEIGSERAMTPQTLFPMASLSKQFTTAAIMQLVEQGKIGLDAPVTTYLPHFKMADPRYKDITIRHLLADISGMPDWEESEWDYARRTTSPEALDQVIGALATYKLTGDPGKAEYLYSNAGFDILGDVVAKVSGQPFEKYVHERFFDPLGMTSSSFLLAEIDPSTLTKLHWQDKAGKVVVSPEMPDYDQVHTPSGGLLSNVKDMSRWMLVNLSRGELDGRHILKAASYGDMWTPQTDADWGIGGMFQKWGLGWELAELGGHPFAWWGGLMFGGTSTMILAPRDGLGVIVIANASPSESYDTPWYAVDLATALTHELLGIETNAQAIDVKSGYAEVNGTRLYYEMAGEGEPIVMIHGLGWDTRSWDNQFAEFAKQYKVIRYDMRGFGKSDMPTDQPYAHADDLKALLDYLKIDAAHVLGHSFGGEIAINFALAYPKATRSLVLIEPDIQGAQGLPAMTAEEEASFAAAMTALEKDDHAGAAKALVDIHPLVAVSKNVPGVREQILKVFTDYQWFQFLSKDPVVQPLIPSAQRIGEIAAPTLVAVGDSTTEFQKIEVDRLAEQAPNARKVVFKNSDHFPHLLYPKEFNAMVLEFLAKGQK